MTTPAVAPVPPLPTPVLELYRQVWRHARGARGRLVAALSLLGSSQLLKLALPWMAAQAINAMQTSGRAGLKAATLWIVAIVGLNAAAWMLFGPARVLERGVALRVRRSVADELYLRVAQAPLAWHEGHHSGDLQHRVAQTSQALYSFTQSQFIYLQNIVHLARPLLALWWLSRPTGALALASFVGIALLVLRFDRALMRPAESENQAELGYAARLLDVVGNISAVASLRLQQATRALLDARLMAVFAPLSRSIVITEWKWCAVDLLTLALGWALVVLYASTLPGALLIGSLLMVHQYAQQASNVLCSMAANFQGLAHTQVDHAGAQNIRDAPQTAATVAPLPNDWQRIDIDNLSYCHAAEHAGDRAAGNTARGGVHGATLALQRGERVALVGPSGSGKSTLLRMLAGLYTAQQGAVLVDGQPQAGRPRLGQ